MKDKKLIILILMMAIFMLSSCSINNNKTVDEPSSTPEVTKSQPVDLGTCITLNAYTGEIYKKENALVSDYIQEKIKEEYNIIIELDARFIGETTFVDILNKSLASGTAIDGISGSSNLLSNYASYDYLLMDIIPLLNDYGKNLKKILNDDDLLKADIGGKVVGILDKTLPHSYYTVIRTDILEKLNLDMPTDMQGLISYCLKCQDAGYSSYPLAITMQQFERTWASSWEVPYDLFAQADGTVWPMEYHPNYGGFIKQIAYLYENKFINPDFASALYTDQRDKFISGSALIWEMHIDETYTTYNDLKSNAAGASLGIMKNLIINGYSKASLISENAMSQKMLWFLNSGNAPEALMVFKDYTCKSLENYLTVKYGVPNVHYELSAAGNSMVYPLSPYGLNNIYKGQFMLNSSFYKIYPPLPLKNAKDVYKASNALEIEAYDYLSHALQVKSGVSSIPNSLSKEAYDAMLYYNLRINAAVLDLVQDNINYAEFDEILREISPKARIWCDEVSAS